MNPNLLFEKKLWSKGFKNVVGVDEAGRGPLAGPVVAAAVMIKLELCGKKRKFNFKNLKLLQGVKDSKKLSPKKREIFYKIITKNPEIGWGIGRVSEKVIDKINIFNASKLAMRKAVKALEKKLSAKYSVSKSRIDVLLLDGNFKIEAPYSQQPIVKADEKIFSCSAASIIAKVTRDRIMRKYHKKYPQYGFAKHKGYPTLQHRVVLKKYGPCAIHRKSFRF